MRIKIYALLISLSFISSGVVAQGTFTQVHQILQTNCAGASCHQYGGNPSFDVTGSEAALYAQLVNGTVLNPAATAKYNKLVVPGDAQRSFLLRKLAHGISDGLALIPAEGAAMPSGLPAIANYKIELVRQWILAGAPAAGNVVDTALINRYYRNGGIDDTYSPHLPPPAGQGFQIYWGRVFVPPSTEKEYFLKYNPHLTTALESPRIDFMTPNVATHHFVVFNFQIGGSNNYIDGMRFNNSQMDVTFGIGAGKGLTSNDLPSNCAYFFDQGLIYDLNLHIKNPFPDTVLSTDIYINIYTQPVGTAQNYMIVRNFINENIAIPRDSIEHTYTMPAYDSAETHTWKLWQLYTHTHQYGLDFDVYLRNANGTKGDQVYEGTWSYEQGFSLGYYGWGTDVTIRTFPGDSLLEVDPRLGFIYEAKYKNTNGPDTCFWGETSMDEMMVMGFQYVAGRDITSVREPDNKEQFVKIFPNPSRNQFVISYELAQSENVQIELVNLLGERTATLVNTLQNKGKHSQTLRSADYGLSAGIYFVVSNISGKTSTQKLIITD